MKLKKFLVTEEELEEFCELQLAYLIDDNFNVKCELVHSVKNYIRISIKIGSDVHYTSFYWNEFSDHFIPFIKILSREYKLLSFTKDSECLVSILGLDWTNYTIAELEDIKGYKPIRMVRVMVDINRL